MTRRRGAAALWGLVVLGVAIWLALQLRAGRGFDGDLTTLLPATARDPVIASATREVRERFERRLVLLVGGGAVAAALEAAAEVRVALTASGQVARLETPAAEAARSLATFLFSYRGTLLSDAIRAQLAAGDWPGFGRGLLRRLHSPLLPVSSSVLEHDPLLLLAGYLEQRAALLGGRLTLVDGQPVVRAGAESYVLIQAVLAGSPFAFELQAGLMPVLADLRAGLAARNPPVALLTAGVLPQAAAGTASARHEISLFGSASVAAIALLMVLAFRSATPLALGLLVGGVGCLIGLACCVALFPSVHMLTLVFGVSLIGTAIDYPLHYFATRFAPAPIWRPEVALAHTITGLTLALITTLIGFAGLLLTGFPGLVQIACFSIAGLIAAYLSTVLWLPLLTRPGPPLPPGRLLRAAGLWLRCWDGRAGFCLGMLALALVVVIGSFGAFRLRANDDVRQFQALDPEVAAEGARVQSLIGEAWGSRFFLVEGPTPDDLLAREEALAAILRPLETAGALAGHLALSTFVPSGPRQVENLALLRRALLEGAALRSVAEQAGLPARVVASFAAGLATARPLGLEAWLGDPSSAPYRELYLGETARGVASIVLLSGVRDGAALAALNLPAGVHAIDLVGDVSAIFATYRDRASRFVLAAYGLTALLLLARYGWRSALLLVAPLTAVLACLGVFGLTGVGLSLFHVMALLLVLAFGIDYSLFFREAGDRDRSTLIAIACSALTSLLAFGMLALSATAAISAFGQTIAIGIGTAFLLSPIARWARPPGSAPGALPASGEGRA